MSQTFTPNHINPIQWQQTLGLARTACARIFRDGGQPADALAAFGIGENASGIDWSTATDRIAASMCQPKMRKAA
jgi:hypothetical protein